MMRSGKVIGVVFIIVIMFLFMGCTPYGHAKDIPYDFRMFTWGVSERFVLDNEPATFYLRWHDEHQRFVLSFQTQASLGDITVPCLIDYIFDAGNRLIEGQERYLITDSAQEALVSYGMMKERLQKRYEKEPQKKTEVCHEWELERTNVTLSLWEDANWLFVSVFYVDKATANER